MTDDKGLLPTTYLTVLSLVGSGARYGYEISKIIEERGYTEWVDIQMSSVYKALSELEDRDLLRGKKAEAGVRPSKKTYELTRKGRKTLKEQISECISSPPKTKTVFDLGLSAATLLNKTEVLKALEKYRSKLESDLEFLRSHTKAVEDIDELRVSSPEEMIGQRPVSDIKEDEPLGIVHALFDRPRAMVECRLEWLGGLIKRIEEDPSYFGFTTVKERKN